MATISYAQNGEDIVLARAFPADYQGFYVDVGAWDPVADSVTKLFYDRGWHGINVEPSSSSLATLVAGRPRDVNLGVGIGDAEGEAAFYELGGEFAGTSTFVTSLADGYRDHGRQVTSRDVEVTTLAALCEEHVGERTIDFLKIDAEGGELQVLVGADFTRFRPRIVVVEATEPGTPVPSHQDWEHILIDARYGFVLFDGLNRFYVREEDAGLASVLAAPANVLDDYMSYETAQLSDHAARLNAELELVNAQRELLSADVTKLNAELSEAWAEKIDLIDDAEGAQIAASNARDMVALLRARLDSASGELETVRRERDQSRATLEEVRQSKVMRLTSDSREVYYKLRRWADRS